MRLKRTELNPAYSTRPGLAVNQHDSDIFSHQTGLRLSHPAQSHVVRFGLIKRKEPPDPIKVYSAARNPAVVIAPNNTPELTTALRLCWLMRHGHLAPGEKLTAEDQIPLEIVETIKAGKTSLEEIRNADSLMQNISRTCEEIQKLTAPSTLVVPLPNGTTVTHHDEGSLREAKETEIDFLMALMVTLGERNQWKGAPFLSSKAEAKQSAASSASLGRSLRPVQLQPRDKQEEPLELGHNLFNLSWRKMLVVGDESLPTNEDDLKRFLANPQANTRIAAIQLFKLMQKHPSRLAMLVRYLVQDEESIKAYLQPAPPIYISARYRTIGNFDRERSRYHAAVRSINTDVIPMATDVLNKTYQLQSGLRAWREWHKNKGTQAPPSDAETVRKAFEIPPYSFESVMGYYDQHSAQIYSENLRFQCEEIQEQMIDDYAVRAVTRSQQDSKVISELRTSSAAIAASVQADIASSITQYLEREALYQQLKALQTLRKKSVNQGGRPVGRDLSNSEEAGRFRQEFLAGFSGSPDADRMKQMLDECLERLRDNPIENTFQQTLLPKLVKVLMHGDYESQFQRPQVEKVARDIAIRVNVGEYERCFKRCGDFVKQQLPESCRVVLTQIKTNLKSKYNPNDKLDAVDRQAIGRAIVLNMDLGLYEPALQNIGQEILVSVISEVLDNEDYTFGKLTPIVTQALSTAIGLEIDTAFSRLHSKPFDVLASEIASNFDELIRNEPATFMELDQDWIDDKVGRAVAPYNAMIFNNATQTVVKDAFDDALTRIDEKRNLAANLSPKERVDIALEYAKTRFRTIRPPNYRPNFGTPEERAQDHYTKDWQELTRGLQCYLALIECILSPSRASASSVSPSRILADLPEKYPNVRPFNLSRQDLQDFIDDAQQVDDHNPVPLIKQVQERLEQELDKKRSKPIQTQLQAYFTEQVGKTLGPHVEEAARSSAGEEALGWFEDRFTEQLRFQLTTQLEGLSADKVFNHFNAMDPATRRAAITARFRDLPTLVKEMAGSAIAAMPCLKTETSEVAKVYKPEPTDHSLGDLIVQACGAGAVLVSTKVMDRIKTSALRTAKAKLEALQKASLIGSAADDKRNRLLARLEVLKAYDNHFSQEIDVMMATLLSDPEWIYTIFQADPSLLRKFPGTSSIQMHHGAKKAELIEAFAAEQAQELRRKFEFHAYSDIDLKNDNFNGDMFNPGQQALLRKLYQDVLAIHAHKQKIEEDIRGQGGVGPVTLEEQLNSVLIAMYQYFTKKRAAIVC